MFSLINLIIFFYYFSKISDKTDTELFKVDRKSDSSLLLSARDKRKLLAQKPLQCVAALANTSKVTDPNRKRNVVNSLESKRHYIVKQIREAKIAKPGYVDKKKVMAVEQRRQAYQRTDENKKNNKRGKFETDIWENEPRKKPSNLINQWFTEELVGHTLKNTQQEMVKTPVVVHEKRSQLKAMEVPHPGTSYNPSLKDHQDLMDKVIEKEEKIIKVDEHLNRVTKRMFSKITAEERDRRDMEEMATGVIVKGEVSENVEDGEDAEEKSDEDENVYTPINPPTQNKKKDKKQRKNQRVQREIKEGQIKKKIEKKKVTDIHRVKFIETLIGHRSKSLKDQHIRKKELSVKRKYLPRRLGSMKFSEPEIDITTPENISGNLRNLKPEGHILADRFKSMQRRNLIAPNKDVGLAKRAKVKYFVKNTHKAEANFVRKTKPQR